MQPSILYSKRMPLSDARTFRRYWNWLRMKSIGNASPLLFWIIPENEGRVPRFADFFAALPRVDAIHAFEPSEFIEAGDHVVVLGWEKTTALDTNKIFETEWAHVFTIRNDRIVRWRGFFDTAARYAI